MNDLESTPRKRTFSAFRKASDIAKETSRHSAIRLDSSSRCSDGGLSESKETSRHAAIDLDASSKFSIGRMSKRSMFGRGTVVSNVEELIAGLKSFLVSCLITNYISVGYLFLPWAFAHTGMLLTSVIFTLVMGLTYVTSTYVMEACARAEFLAAQEEDNLISMEEATAQINCVNLDATNFSAVSKLSQGSAKVENQNSKNFSNTASDPLVITHGRKFELPDLARVFLGERWRYFFTVTTLIDLYGITWAAASVFALSMDVEFSIGKGNHDYEMFILIFAAIVIPLSFFHVIDQVRVQMVFLCGRVLMVLLMIITTAAAYQSDKPHFQVPLEGSQRYNVPLADTSNLSTSIQIAIFSTAYQFSVPVIAETSKHPSKLPRMYGSACIYLFVTMLVSSLVVAGYFGPDYIEESCNLNWKNYTGGTGILQGDGTSTGTAWWARLVSYYVVFFPVIDGVSIFSLCAFSLGEILKGFWHGDKVHELEDNWKEHIVFRLLGCVPQLVGATFVSDLGAIANFAGIFTVLSYTVCPCLVAIYSSKLFRSVDFPTETRYHTLFSNEIWGWIIAFLGLSSIAYTLVASIAQY